MKSNPAHAPSQLTSDGHVSTNGSSPPQAEPDPFVIAYDWHFVVLNPADQIAMVTCSYPGNGLVVAHALSRDLDRFVEGKDVIVVAPELGPGVDLANGIANRLERLAKKLVLWPCPGLGSEEAPDLPTFEEFYGQGEEGSLARALIFDHPWTWPPFRATSLPVHASGNVQLAAAQAAPFDPKELSDEALGLTWAKDVTAENVPYLWPDMLTRGEMALLAGPPGIGKTTIAIELGARMTTGSLWPDDKSRAPVGQVIILSAEDSWKTTLKPRFVAAGADINKVAFLKAQYTVKQADGLLKVNYTSFTDLDWWDWTLDRAPELLMLIVDPVVSYLGRGVNDQRNSDLRAVFERFIEKIVRPRKFALYAITHFSKKVDLSNPLEKITGSGAYAAVPRHVHFVHPSHQQKDASIFMQIKGSTAPSDLPWLHYRIDKKEITCDKARILTSSLVFLPMLTGMHQQDLGAIMDGHKGRPGPRPEKTTKVADWLWKRLQGGEWIARRVIVREARRANLVGESPSATSLERARKSIAKLHSGWLVEAKRLDFGEGQSKISQVAWRLVEKPKKGDIAADLPF
jgi:hypothetical protein